MAESTPDPTDLTEDDFTYDKLMQDPLKYRDKAPKYWSSYFLTTTFLFAVFVGLSVLLMYMWHTWNSKEKETPSFYDIRRFSIDNPQIIQFYVLLIAFCVGVLLTFLRMGKKDEVESLFNGLTDDQMKMTISLLTTDTDDHKNDNYFPLIAQSFDKSSAARDLLRAIKISGYNTAQNEFIVKNTYTANDIIQFAQNRKWNQIIFYWSIAILCVFACLAYSSSTIRKKLHDFIQDLEVQATESEDALMKSIRNQKRKKQKEKRKNKAKGVLRKSKELKERTENKNKNGKSN